MQEDAENRNMGRPVKAFRSKAVTLRIGTPSGIWDVLKVVHHKDGSLFLTFPEFSDSRGIVAECTMPPGLPPASVSLEDKGRVTGHLVKYTHHESGIVQFSQTGRVKSDVRRHAEPLEGFEGHLWTCQVQDLSGFRQSPRAASTQIDSKDQALTFNFGDPRSGAFKFVAFMYRGDRLGRRLAPGTTGPIVNAVSPDGKPRPAFLVSAPLGWKGDQRVLMLIGENVPDLTAEPGSHLTFAGGFDHEDRVNSLSLSTSFLALSYPVTDFDALRDRIGTIDLPRKEG